MKRLFSFLLASVMVLSLLSGCNKEPVKEEPKNVTIEETVIYDKNDITITLKDMKKNNLGVEFSVDMRNRSENNIILTSTYLVVNGITVSGGCYIECGANRSVQDTLYLYKSSLENAGIQTVATVRGIDCSIVSSDSFTPLHSFSFELVTSAGADYQQEINTDGDLLLDVKGIRVLSQNFTSDVNGNAARLVIVNNSGKNVIVEAKEIMVNGISVDGKLYTSVFTDSVCFSSLSLSSSALQKANITSIESISFKLNITDATTYTSILKSQEVVIRIN